MEWYVLILVSKSRSTCDKHFFPQCLGLKFQILDVYGFVFNARIYFYFLSITETWEALSPLQKKNWIVDTTMEGNRKNSSIISPSLCYVYERMHSRSLLLFLIWLLLFPFFVRHPKENMGEVRKKKWHPVYLFILPIHRFNLPILWTIRDGQRMSSQLLHRNPAVLFSSDFDTLCPSDILFFSYTVYFSLFFSSFMRFSDLGNKEEEERKRFGLANRGEWNVVIIR